jgi:hypothetical protein
MQGRKRGIPVLRRRITVDTDRYERSITVFTLSDYTDGVVVKSVIDFEELEKQFNSESLVHAFLNDDDVQEMQLTSSSLGFVKTFGKTMRK